AIAEPPPAGLDASVAGPAIADNRRVKAPRGTVRALDARTGKERWTWSPLREGIDAGGANVWAPMSVDEVDNSRADAGAPAALRRGRLRADPLLGSRGLLRAA